MPHANCQCDVTLAIHPGHMDSAVADQEGISVRTLLLAVLTGSALAALAAVLYTTATGHSANDPASWAMQPPVMAVTRQAVAVKPPVAMPASQRTSYNPTMTLLDKGSILAPENVGPSSKPQGILISGTTITSIVSALSVAFLAFFATLRRPPSSSSFPHQSLQYGTTAADQEGCCHPCRCCARAGQPLDGNIAASPVGAGSWAMAASYGQKKMPSTEVLEGWEVRNELLKDLLAKSADQPVLLQVLEEHWEELARTGKYAARLQEMASEGNDSAVRVLEAMNVVVAKLMEVAQARLQNLVKTMEVNDLDKQIIQMAHNREIDMAFLRVVDINIEASQKDGNANNMNFFTHIRTRCVEEIEKKARPADGLISRALRQADPGIRQRILEDFLLPKSVVNLPSGKELQLDKPVPPKVTVAQFADAVADTVQRLQALGVENDLVDEAIEDVRQLAKDVRQVLIQEYDDEKVRWYEQRLGEVFAPILAKGSGTSAVNATTAAE